MPYKSAVPESNCWMYEKGIEGEHGWTGTLNGTYELDLGHNNNKH
jgi:hypothetical protein